MTDSTTDETTLQQELTRLVDGGEAGADAPPIGVLATDAPHDPGQPAVEVDWVNPTPKKGGRRVVGIEYDGRNLVLLGLREDGSDRAIERLWVGKWEENPTSDKLAERLTAFAPGERPEVEVLVGTQRGVLRRLRIPPLKANKRRLAALWEGAKLVPFPLTDDEALFGFDLHQDGKRGWWVTLLAMPRADGAPIIDAVTVLGWKLRHVGMVGTQQICPCANAPAESRAHVRAVVVTASRRGSFAIFHEERLRFHYEMGPLTSPLHDADELALPNTPELLRAAIDALNKAIGDALDFYVNANPGVIPSQLELIGIPETAAPLVTDWRDRFEAGVAVVDPVRPLCDGLPDDVSEWVGHHSGVLAPAVLAIIGKCSMDLTPSAIKAKERGRRLAQYARSVFVLSVVGAIVWSGLLWQHVRNVAETVEADRAKSAQIVESPTVAKANAALGTLAAQSRRLAVIRQPSRLWMPWARTVLNSLPDNASLTAFDFGYDNIAAQAEASLYVHLEGSLSPGGPPHAVVYSRWIDRLESLAGKDRVEIVSTHEIEWKGRTRSVFSFRLKPDERLVTQDGATP